MSRGRSYSYTWAEKQLASPTSPRASLQLESSLDLVDSRDDASWKQIQKNVFTRWCNERLKVVKIPMDDLAVDLTDGTKLVALVQVLSHKMVGRYNKKPRIYAQKMENAQLALDMLTKVEKIKIVNIGSGDIVEGNPKLTLGLIWTLILHYQISIGFGIDEKKKGGASAKQVLIEFVKDFVPQRKIANFTTDWNDGTMVAALVDATAPGLCPEAYTMKPENALENANQAMTLARDWLGVPMVLLPEDIVNPRIDPLSVITYVSQFPEAKLKEGAPLKEMGDASKVKAYGDGLKAEGLTTNDIDAEFFVDVSEAGSGPLKVEIVTPQELKIHPGVEFDEKKKLFTYKYTPGEDGQYTVKISWCGKAIPNSPFLVKVVGTKRARAATLGRSSTPTGSISCKVYGPGVESKELTALAPAEFWIEEVPVRTKLQVKIIGPKGVLSSSAFAIESIGKGKFYVIYRPSVAGNYKIEISAAGKEITSSPYKVTVGEKKALLGWARGPGVDGIDLDVEKATWFKVFTPSASNRDIIVTIEGPKKTKVSSTSAKVIDAIFRYTYTPKEKGVYKITILVGPKKTQQTLFFSVTVPSSVVKGPCKVWGPGLTACGIQVNRMSMIFAQPLKRTEKKAVIALAVSGPSNEKVTVTDEEGPDEVHTYTYQPSKIGCYTISVLFEDSPIPDFPVKVNVTDVSKVALSGPGVNGEPVPVNKAVCILADTTEAGPGNLECQLLAIEAPNQKEADKFASAMAPKLQDKGDGKTEIKFTPKLPCTASLALTFDDIPLSQSPLKLNVAEMKPIKVFGRGILDGNAAGAPTYFMVDVAEAGPGKLKVAISGPQKQPTVKISNPSKEMFKCEYTPPVKGDYTAEVSFGGMPAEGSPFKFKVLPKGSPQEFLVHGPALSSGLLVGSPTEFFLVKGDTPVNETAAMIQTPSVETIPTTEPIDENITKCTFTPREPGTYKIDVKADETPVPGSPFETTATFPEGVPKVVATGEGLEKAYVDEWAQFNLDYSKAGPGSIGLSVDGPKRVETKVEEGQDGKALVKYLPPKKGEYVINVTYNKQEIAGNPFTVQAIPRELETAVTKVVKLEAKGIKLGDEFSYKVDASAMPKERLSGKIVGPFKKEALLPQELISTSVTLKSLPKLLVGRQSLEPDVTAKGTMYTIKFTPTEIGIYLLYVFVGDGLVPRMPYKIFVCDPTKVKVTGSGLKEETQSFDVGKPLNWQADCTRAGPGTLKAYSGGPDECSMNFVISPLLQKEDCYSIQYIPDIPGSYQILFAYSGYDLADKPVIMVGDSSKAQVQESDKKVCLVGEEVSFKVDLSAAGAGKLQANLEGPAEVPISFSKNGDGTCNFSFTPSEAGDYTLSVSFGENLLTDKPLEVTAIAPEKVEVTGPGVTGKGACVGKPAKVVVDCTEGGVAPLQATLTTPQEEVLPLELQPVTENEPVFETEYTPEDVGIYELDVKLANKPVKNSPFKAAIASPEKVKVCNTKPVYANPGETVKLECYTNEAGPGMLTATLFNPNDKEQHPEEVIAQPLTDEEGHYEIPIKVSPGVQSAEVCYNDIPVCAPIPIVGGSKPECIVEGPGIKPKVALGRDTYFTVDTSKAGNGDVSAAVHKPDEGVLPINVSKPKHDLFEIHYTPEEVGEYIIDITYQGIPLENTPYKTACIDTASLTLKTNSPKRVRVGEPVSMTADFSECSEGDFNVSLAGPVECPLVYKPNDDGKGATFTFTPTEPGVYEANGVLDELPVSEIPLTTDVIEPDKVKISGPGVTGKGASVGKPTEVVVDTTEAGPAPVEGVLSTPLGEKQPLEFQPKDESSPDILTASYTPQTPGDYQLDLTFDDEPIKDSPFTAKILDADAIHFEGPGVESAALEEENIIDLFVPKIVPEEVTMVMMTEDHQEIPFEFLVEKVDDDHCQIQFTPEVVGVCEATLSYAGVPLFDPIEIAVGNPSKCKVSGPGIEEDKLPVGEETCFTVDSTEAGPGKPKVTIAGPNDSKIEPSCTEEKPGVTKVTYTPQVGGPHEVSVLFGGHDVPGSPYTVPVCNPEAVKCTPVNPENKKYHPGDEIVLAVDLKDAGEGDFSLGLTGPENQPIVSEEAFIALIPVEESIDGNTEIVQLKPEGLKPGSTFPYSIDTSGVQTGDVISGRVVGPFKSKKKVPKNLLSDKITLQSLPTLLTEDQKLLEPEVKESNKIYDVNFTPEEVGVYILYVFLGDNLVDDMPCKLTVCDANEVKVTGPGLSDTEGNCYPLGIPLIWEAYCTNAGPGKLAAYCAGPDDCSKKFKISPMPGKENCFFVEYIPKKPGPYQMMFAYGDYEVPQKPTLSVTKQKRVALLGIKKDKQEDSTSVKQPQEGKIDCSLNDDGTYNFAFKPEEPGLYNFLPTLCDQPVFEEPLRVLVTDPDKVKVTGPGVTGKGVQIGQPTDIIVDKRLSGPGPVEAVLSMPSGETQKLEFEPKEESEPNILIGHYTPQFAGYHSLSFTFDDQTLPLSPQRVYVVNPEEFKLEGEGLKEAIIGEVNTINCFLEDSPEDRVFSMMTEDKDGVLEPLECKTVKVDQDHCCVEFVPETETACFAFLYFNEVPISDKIALAPNNIDGVKISGINRCQGVIVNKERSFTADFRGCTAQEVMAVSFIQADESELKPTIIETDPGVYKIFFTPTVLGLLKIRFTYGEEAMTYNVFVIDPSAVVCTGLGGDSILVTEKLVFAIDTSAAGVGAMLKVELEGEEQASLSCQHMMDGHYSGLLSVVLAGVYNLRVFYGSYEIKGSPFECKFHRPEPDASLCSITDIENNPGKIFVDCRQAGGCGLLEVAVLGAYVPAKYIAVEHNGDYTFNVTYDIPDPVETLISVKWHGQHLKGSPFKVVFKK